MNRFVLTSQLFIVLAVLIGGCAGYKMTPIPAGRAAEAWDSAHSKEGYIIYEPAPFLLANRNADGAEEFQIVFLPDRTRPYRFTRYEFFAKSDLDITLKDGWQFTGAKSSTDSTAALTGLLELAKSLVPTRGENASVSSSEPRLWRILIDAAGVRLEHVKGGEAAEGASESHRRDAQGSTRESNSPLAAVTSRQGPSDPPRRSPIGRSLCVGLNRVDPSQYEGWSGPLSGCENDARDMAALLSHCGFATATLLTEDATLKNVLRALESAGRDLEAGDYFVLSISSHGGQVPDVNGDEDDGLDETWCLYDGELLDDVVFGALQAFRKGVRVVIVSDSCHAGTPLRMTREDFSATPPERLATLQGEFLRLQNVPADAQAMAIDANANVPREVIRAMPPEQCLATYRKHQKFYDGIGQAAPRERRDDINGTVLSLGACEDAETSADGFGNGLYTEWLQRTWNGGAFQGSFAQLQSAVRAAVAKRRNVQHPSTDAFGPNSDGLRQQRPFKLIP